MTNKKAGAATPAKTKQKALSTNGNIPPTSVFCEGSHPVGTGQAAARDCDERILASQSLRRQTPIQETTGHEKNDKEARLGRLYDVWRLMVEAPGFKSEELSRAVLRVSAHVLEAALDDLRSEVIDDLPEDPRQ